MSTLLNDGYPMKKEDLTQSEMNAWRGFRRMGEVIASRIGREITQKTGLSSADFTILMQLSMNGGNHQRQCDIQTFLEWDKTRLSHQLSRMETRGLIEKKSEDRNSSFISMTDKGRLQLSMAQPVHQNGIYEHFAKWLSEEDLEAMIRITDILRNSSK